MDRALFILHVVSISLSYIAFFFACLAALLYLIQDNNLKNKRVNVIASRLPDLSFLDKFNYKSIGLGFPILTLALASGFLRLGYAGAIFPSGGNNPRVVYSLVLWLLYAVILHARLSSRLRGRKVAYLSIAAFMVIIFTVFSRCT